MATSGPARWTGALLSTLLACLAAPARAQTEAELASALWVEGRVRFPPGTPADEQCFVVARGLRFDEGDWHRAAVGPDGSFRVAFHPRSKRGWLMLEGRYCLLDRGLRWEPDSAGPHELVPELGARLTVRLLPPEGFASDDLDRRVILHGELRSTATFEAGPRARMWTPVTLGPELLFESGPLRTNRIWFFDLLGEGLCAETLELDLQPGQHAHQDLQLLRGVELNGRVIDEAGLGVAEARVVARSKGHPRTTSRTRSTTSAPNGNFWLSGLLPGETELTATLGQGRNARLDLGPLGDGEVRDVLVLVPEQRLLLHLDLAVEGEPPAGRVRLVREEQPNVEQEIWAEAPGRYVAAPSEAGRVRLELTAGDGRWSRTIFVKESGQRVEVDLRLGVLSGRVERGGQALAAALVTARGRHSPSDGSVLAHATTDAEGRYSLRLPEGTYCLQAQSPLHDDVESQRRFLSQVQGLSAEVVAGTTTHAPDLELPHESLVLGVVRTAGGDPAPGAFVRAWTGQASLTSEHEGLHCGSFARETRADEDGRFRIEDVPAGSLHLGASLMRGRGESEVVAHVEPGLNMLDLHLPLDSWLVVEVVDRAGTRKACEVSARDASGKRHRAEQDGVGLYWIGLLPPGPYEVEVELDTRRLERSVTLAGGEGRRDVTIQVE